MIGLIETRPSIDGSDMIDNRLYKIAREIANIPPSHNMRVGGVVEFRRDQGPVRRDIRTKDFKWSSDSLRDLAKILWAGQRAHSYAIAALRIFSKMSSSEFSPDGLLGGRGYIQSIKDLRSGLSNAIEVLSSFTDTVHDEINADHWAPVEEKANIEGIVADVGEVKGNPEGFVEKEFDQENIVENPVAENPEVEEESEIEEESEEEEPDPSIPRTSSDGMMYDRYAMAFDNLMNQRTASSRLSGGALDEFIVPGPEPTITDREIGGPRAFPLGPASGGEFGNFDDPCCPSNLKDTSMEDQELLLDRGLFFPTSLPGGDGDDYRLSRTVRQPQTYSWLPGADNRKSMNIYGLGLTEEDVKWMEEHSQPDVPGTPTGNFDSFSESLWDGVRIK